MGKLLLFRLRPSLCTGINLPKVSENRRNLWCINNENRVDFIQEWHELPIISLIFKYQHIGLIKNTDLMANLGITLYVNDLFWAVALMIFLSVEKQNMLICTIVITFYVNDLIWVVALIICPELLIIVWRVVWPPFDLCYQLPAAFDASSQKMVLYFHRGIITINFIGQLIFDRLLVLQRVSTTYLLYLWKNDYLNKTQCQKSILLHI